MATPTTYPMNTRETTAAFSFDAGSTWRWFTWKHANGNKHAAIIAKAAEIGANAWDFGQAFTTEVFAGCRG